MGLNTLQQTKTNLWLEAGGGRRLRHSAQRSTVEFELKMPEMSRSIDAIQQGDHEGQCKLRSLWEGAAGSSAQHGPGRKQRRRQRLVPGAIARVPCKS